MKPTQILARICKDESLDGPHYTAPGKCRVENMIFAASSSIIDEAGNKHFEGLLCMPISISTVA